MRLGIRSAIIQMIQINFSKREEKMAGPQIAMSAAQYMNVTEGV